MFKFILGFFADDRAIMKTAIGSAFGFTAGTAGLESLDFWLSVTLKFMGILAFLGTFIVALPKIVELLSKMSRAIKTTFYD